VSIINRFAAYVSVRYLLFRAPNRPNWGKI